MASSGTIPSNPSKPDDPTVAENWKRCKLQSIEYPSTAKTMAEYTARNLKMQSRQIQYQPKKVTEHLAQDLNVQSKQTQSQPEDLTTERDQLRQQVQKLEKKISFMTEDIAYLEQRLDMLETTSYDGTLMWKILGYERRKQEGISGETVSIFSQPFYTHKYGYKMCARVYLNGDGMGKGTHMSLFFVVLQGLYDKLLPWPFRQKVTMTLLDQTNEQKNIVEEFKPDPHSTSFMRPTTAMNTACGCPKFVPHSVLETPRYIKDGTFFLKLQVDLKKLKHP